MIEIRFVCNLEKLTPAEKPVIASGDVNSVQLRVDFCQKWDKYAKAAVFFRKGDPTPIECPMTANACIVPPEVLAESGTFYFGIRGVVADDVTAAILTTDVVGYRVVDGAPSGVDKGPTPDVYQQILTGYGKMDATKQNKLAWATDADIEAMFDGTYEGEEDEDPEGNGYLPGKDPEGGSPDAVTYTPQNKTEKEKAQARDNIGITNDPDCHAQYFDITEEGVLSVKDGAELPAHLIIPEIVDGIVVNSLAAGMFSNNTAIEYVTLPRTIKEIPDYCFYLSCQLKEIFGTENITALGEAALCRASSLIRASFPNLTSMKLQSIQACPSLVYADVGKVQTISEYSLADNINMQRLKNSGNVTGIAPSAFFKCGKLKHFENIENITTIEATGLWGCGIPYTEQAKLSGSATGTNAIAPKVNPTDFWSACAFTPCENPLPTYLSQRNPVWANSYIGSSSKKYMANGCMLFDVVHAYCGLHNLKLSDIAEVEALFAELGQTSLLNNYSTGYEYQKTLAEGMGMNVEQYGTVDQTTLQALYDALAAGKYASVTISSGNNGSVKGHVALIYGVTANGELMFCDCASAWWNDYTKPYLYALPVQNIVAHSIENRNTILEIYSV